MNRFLAGFLAATLLNLALSAQEATPARKIDLAVVGASVSAGFGSDYDLAEALEIALGAEARITDEADSALFLDVQGRGANMLAAAAKAKPELVIAIDYLFWFASGPKDLDTRKKDLTSALDGLAGLRIPVVVGSVPDMRHASPLMLPKRNRIPEDEIAPLNAWLGEEIARRQGLRLIPVAAWMESIDRGERLPAFDHIGLVEVDRKKLLARDGLHLSRAGLAVATCLLLDDLSRHELVDRGIDPSLEVMEKRLAEQDFEIKVSVFAGDETVPAGRLRFDLPEPAAMRDAGLSLTELLKLRELRRYSRPLAFDGGHTVTIGPLPLAARKLKIRVRAERDPGEISAWAEIDLGKPAEDTRLELEPCPALKLKILQGPEALALPGALITVPEELRTRGTRLKGLSGQGPGHATTDERGFAVLDGVGPDVRRLVILPPGGKEVEATIEREGEVQILHIDVVAPEEAAR
ncbi:MAG: hypothetical protein H6807_01100 [Planctomycetes bacterium]|nr:hypothetical protein [Planctomycetota bacterium]